MVRSPKSIAGAVALALGNAPYQIGDRTDAFRIAIPHSVPPENSQNSHTT
ncbi:hypothetical protein VL20_5127 [Microcystis panniformis FACHB-1757]|uniref:Uncharacterized protein n=1 Tax=Microcystis panniformis FACHB-1757 TaxID=1638788 RepID=A0A0K1S7F9_9CHRO|nr:hypothetical protein VL20_5127 [Microcystis panniformis FACHB-1757]